jgi:hypothetical protein
MGVVRESTYNKVLSSRRSWPCSHLRVADLRVLRPAVALPGGHVPAVHERRARAAQRHVRRRGVGSRLGAAGAGARALVVSLRDRARARLGRGHQRTLLYVPSHTAPHTDLHINKSAWA